MNAYDPNPPSGEPMAADLQREEVANPLAGTGKLDEEPDVDLDALVAALISNKSISDWNAVSAFMGAVVPWPGSEKGPGFVNLHYSMPNPTPTKGRELLKGMGWPFRSVDQFVSRVSWTLQHPDKFKDLWFCTSLQSKAGTNKRGF